MPRYRVYGADRNTADERQEVITADSPDDAETVAVSRGLYVNQVVAEPMSTQRAATNQTNAMGIAGFVVGLGSWLTVGLLAPAGVVLSIMALRRPRRGFAIAGLVISGLALFPLIGLVAAGFDTSDSSPSTATSPPQSASTAQPPPDPARSPSPAERHDPIPSPSSGKTDPMPSPPPAKAEQKQRPDFVSKNVSYRGKEYGGVEIIGEIKNQSGQSYQVATFTLSVYDRSGNLVATSPINVSNFGRGQTKSFNTSVFDVSIERFNRFKIQYDGGL